MRLARSYESLRGPDVEGFVKFIRDQEAVGASQLEAVSEEEGADAVRLLTIHAAKGLEFKVVIVADAGRDTGGPPSADEIIVRPDGRFGFRVLDPKSGKKRPVLDYEAVREAERADERAERLRLYYVAMTRAIDRLIVSGAIDPEKTRDLETPIGWVLSRLGVGDEPVDGRARARRCALRHARARLRAGTAGRTGRERGGAAGAVRRAADLADAARLPPAGAPAAPARAAPQGEAALLLGARALRAVLLPLLRRARRRPSRGAGLARRW